MGSSLPALFCRITNTDRYDSIDVYPVIFVAEIYNVHSYILGTALRSTADCHALLHLCSNRNAGIFAHNEDFT